MLDRAKERRGLGTRAELNWLSSSPEISPRFTLVFDALRSGLLGGRHE